MEPIRKKLRIARSGIYEYGIEEIASVGFDPLNLPDKLKGKSVVLVYRPAPVVAAAASLFNSRPVTYTHPTEDVIPDNYTKYAKGWTVDSASVELVDGEAHISNEATLFEKTALDAYDRGEREISPGYKARYELADSDDYDIIMTGIDSVNHVAFVPAGRGGPSVRVLDAKRKKVLKSGLLHMIKKMFSGTKDSDMGGFREIINHLKVDGSGVESRIGDLKSIASDLPESEGKALLDRYMEDIPAIVDREQTQKEKALDVIADLFEKLDTQAMEESMSIFGKKKSTNDALAGKILKALGATKDSVIGKAVLDAMGEEDKTKDEIPAEPAPATEGTVGVAGPDTVALAAGISLDEIGGDPKTWSPEQFEYVLAELFTMLRKGQSVDEKPAEPFSGEETPAEEAKEEAVEKQEEVSEEKEEKTSDEEMTSDEEEKGEEKSTVDSVNARIDSGKASESFQDYYKKLGFKI